MKEAGPKRRRAGSTRCSRSTARTSSPIEAACIAPAVRFRLAVEDPTANDGAAQLRSCPRLPSRTHLEEITSTSQSFEALRRANPGGESGFSEAVDAAAAEVQARLESAVTADDDESVRWVDRLQRQGRGRPDRQGDRLQGGPDDPRLPLRLRRSRRGFRSGVAPRHRRDRRLRRRRPQDRGHLGERGRTPSPTATSARPRRSRHPRAQSRSASCA